MPRDPNNASSGCIRPFAVTNAEKGVLCHTYDCSVIDYSNGTMNGFILGEVKNSTMAYYDNRTIPNYWSYASNYVLADNFYSSIFGYSLPNHWYALAGNSPSV